MGSISAPSGHFAKDGRYNPRTKTFVEELRTGKGQIFSTDKIDDQDGRFASGMREDLILLAWLIVLLKTGDAGTVTFSWGYASSEHSSTIAKPSNSLSMQDVLRGLDDSAEQVMIAIHDRNRQADSHQTNVGKELIISTELCNQVSTDLKDDTATYLQLQLLDGKLEVRPIKMPSMRPIHGVTWLVATLLDTIRACVFNHSASISNFLQPTALDLDAIWNWNDPLAQSYDFCVHNKISEVAQRLPDKVAIESWDGGLTYAEIDRCSTTLMRSLQDIGGKPNFVVPICFEKSRWTIVAVLAVMKAGMTFALMDPTLPLARLQNMASQVSAKVMIASKQQQDLASSIVALDRILVVEDNTFTHTQTQKSAETLPNVPVSTLMYIIFTSGSTGTPKGVQISHGTYSSSAVPRAQAVGYNEDSRVLDFASYAFDVSIDSMLLTLANGGCLCIPSDEDRMNDINGTIRTMRINYAGLTPSVARILDADVIDSLEGLGLGGEAVSAQDVTHWGRSTRIIIGYGPCECTIGCTINSSAATGYDYISIGRGNGAAMWIVDPDDHEKLMPVGSIGELLVEGPIVGQGYLNDPGKTAAAFIKDPSWLVAGHRHHSGRRGRLYKTGDLGKYDPDGSGGIVFSGRKDTQVKLRGQRVELGEIESQLRARLPPETNVIAEVIKSAGTQNQPMLVAFISSRSRRAGTIPDVQLVPFTAGLRTKLVSAHADLERTLPRYMLPTTYIPVNIMPILISEKTDRKRLRNFGATVDLRSLDLGAGYASERSLNDFEFRLRQAWSTTLHMNEDTIGLDDNFFILGGDSLAAMSLVSTCRANGLELTVANIFGNPRLSAMATAVKMCEKEILTHASPFSTIQRSVEAACSEAAIVCGTTPAAIEDIYSCTPTQESLFTFSLKSSEVYIAQRVALIPEEYSIDLYMEAWEQVVAQIPILRTRVAQLEESGLQQVVLKEDIQWSRSEDLQDYLVRDRLKKIELGQNLARYAIIQKHGDTKRHMVWTVHHVLYDGWSEPLVLKKLSQRLTGQQIERTKEIRDFVTHIRAIDYKEMNDYWRRELHNAVGPQFPALPSRDYIPTSNGAIERQVLLQMSANSPFTMATLIRGAWALVASQYTGTDDIVFGETLTGRDMALPGIESIIGPLIATVPVRVRIDRSSKVESYLQLVQQALLERTNYQHMGMQYIRKVSADAQHACEAPTGLVIQPEPEKLDRNLGFLVGDVVREALHFNPYPLMVAFGLREDGFRVCASFDINVIPVSHMERILGQIEQTCAELCEDMSRPVSSIAHLPQAELNQIWEWNKIAPLSLDLTFGTLRASASTEPGASYPPAVVPWICDPRNTSHLSPVGSVGEVCLEGAFLPGDTIPAPSWLVKGTSKHSGRRNKLARTGDLALRIENGDIQFLRSKTDASTIQGYVVNTAELESHFTAFLPPEFVGIAVIMDTCVPKVVGESGSRIVVLVAANSAGAIPDEEYVGLITETNEIPTESFKGRPRKPAICSKIPVNLAVALKRLQKFIQDSLPSYLTPSAYLPVQDLDQSQLQDRAYLARFASDVPAEIMTETNNVLKEIWLSGLSKTYVTPKERVLRTAWSVILGLETSKIELDDNFFRLGGDSVLAMKLVSNLSKEGHALTVADVFRYMRLGDAAKVLKLNGVLTQQRRAYEPFSAFDEDALPGLLTSVKARLSDQKWTIKDAYPVTDSQSVDIRATIQAPRTSLQYTTLIFEHGYDESKLNHACEELIRSHDILRTIFVKHDGELIQVVLDKLEIPIIKPRAQEDLNTAIDQICIADIESDIRLGSPFLRLFYVESKGPATCLILRLSHSQYDGVSLPRLLEDLESLCRGQKIPDATPFSTYISQSREKSIQSKAHGYWSSLLDGSSMSVLEGAKNHPNNRGLLRERVVNAPSTGCEFTTASFLTAAWALLLARRLRSPDVAFGNITSGRTNDFADIQNIVGPCYVFTPVRIIFGAEWTAKDLLQAVRTQTAESAAHDFLGPKTIAQTCTSWSCEYAVFDSIVHHQDVIEEVDRMLFDGGECRIETRKPHGDAAYPLKTITYTRGGQLRVGMVGAANDSAFLDACVEELASTFQELVASSSEKILQLD